MVAQVINDRFDVFIGNGRIPGGGHASHQGIPVTSISACPLGDVLPHAAGVVAGRAVQGDQALTLSVGQEIIELVIGVGTNDIRFPGRSSSRGAEMGCQVADDGIDIVAGDRSIENLDHPVHQGPPEGLVAPLTLDDHLTDALGAVAASAVLGHQFPALPIGQERIQ